MFKKILFTPASIFPLLLITEMASEAWLPQRHTSWNTNGVDSDPYRDREYDRLSVTTGYESISNKCKRDENEVDRILDDTTDSEAYKPIVFGVFITNQHHWVQQTTAFILINIKYIIEITFSENRGLSLKDHRNTPNGIWHTNKLGQTIIREVLGRWMNKYYESRQ